MINNKNAQFLLLSTAIILFSMFMIFEFIHTGSETSSILFQPSFSEEAYNLFRSFDSRTDWITYEWYNFSNYQARVQITNYSSNTSMFNISVVCSNVEITDQYNNKKSEKNITTIPKLSSCTIKINETNIGDYIYYYFYGNVTFSNVTNITISKEYSPLHYRNNLRSKLCDHLSSIYVEKQIQMNCSVYV